MMIEWRVTKTVMFVGLLGGASCASNQGVVRGNGTGAVARENQAARSRRSRRHPLIAR